jgi:hypothetical protein
MAEQGEEHAEPAKLAGGDSDDGDRFGHKILLLNSLFGGVVGFVILQFSGGGPIRDVRRRRLRPSRCLAGPEFSPEEWLWISPH